MPPALTFTLDEPLDVEEALHFYRQQEGMGRGMSFWNNALRLCPGLEEIDDAEDKEAFIKSFVARAYRENRPAMERQLRHAEQLFSAREKDFSAALRGILRSEAFFRERYRAFLSIFPFNPRFVKDRSFQFFWRADDDYLVRVIVHELLHFAFFAELRERAPKLFSSLDPDAAPLWDASEIWNVVIQNQPEFLALYGGLPYEGYPAHQPLIPRARELWAETRDIVTWTERMTAEIGSATS